MMCIRCVMKVIGIFKIYVYIKNIYIHIDKLVKLLKLVFGSPLSSSADMHLVGIFIIVVWLVVMF